jgi:hypothetical protein
MKRRIFILALAALFAFAFQAQAQGVGASLEIETITPKSIGGQFVYAVKFLCGTIPHNPADPQEALPGFPLAPGTYRTAINIHNPNTVRVQFTKLALITNPQGKPRGKVGKAVAETLRVEQGLEVDCENIYELLASSPTAAPFIKGFVVIKSRRQLDVTAVYTMKNIVLERGQHGQADLIPVPGPNGFCQKDGQGRLLISVKNQGTAAAGPSITRVEFIPGGAFDVATPAISAGATITVVVPVPIPSVCFDPQCDFRIKVDANSEVAESDEGNNTASGVCSQ